MTRDSKSTSRPPALFDSHCHLTDPQFDGDLKEVLGRARQAGVKEILTVSQNVPDSKQAVALCRKHKGLYCSVGVHPHEADGFRSSDVTALKEKCIEPSVRAIGEIGLDFFRGISSKPNQEIAFEVQIELARMMDLPMVLHVRDASNRARPLLEDHGYFCGVMHCFSMDHKVAEWAVEKGFWISFAGNLTYGDKKLIELAGTIPPSRLMIETDAPYLTPEPERGRRNEPSFLPLTLVRMAEVIGLTPDETARLTRENARRCFRIQD